VSLLDRFEAWLRAEGYAETSITKIRRDVVTMAEHGPQPPNAKSARRIGAYRWAWRAWDDYCAEHELRNGLTEPQVPQQRRRRRRGGRVNVAESIPTAEWRAFLAAVAADDRIEARVIDVQCSTALRVGDVLRSSRAALERGFERGDGLTQLEVKGAKPVAVVVRGGPEREWRRLLDALEAAGLGPHALVCEAISPRGGVDWTAQGAAYRRVDRHLKRLAARAGVTGRIYTHRLRRTVAVQAALAGVPRFKIQKLLNHYSGRTTDVYLDEVMAKESAEIAQIVRGRDDELEG